MDRFLKPNRFDTEPDNATARKQRTQWCKTFENLLASFNTATTPVSDATKLSNLINYRASLIY